MNSKNKMNDNNRFYALVLLYEKKSSSSGLFPPIWSFGSSPVLVNDLRNKGKGEKGKHYFFFNPPSALPDGSKALLAGTETLPAASKSILAASEALLATFEALSPTSKALSAALEALHSWFWGLLSGPLSFFVAIIVP